MAEARILVVEDDPAMAQLICDLLTREGFAADRVGSAREGLVRAARDLPDLILLDLNLPRTDGREVLARINTDGQLRCIPVIILTTSSTDTDILRSYELGATVTSANPSGWISSSA